MLGQNEERRSCACIKKKKYTRLIMWAIQRLERNCKWKSYHSFLLWGEQTELLPLLSVVACPWWRKLDKGNKTRSVSICHVSTLKLGMRVLTSGFPNDLGLAVVVTSALGVPWSIFPNECWWLQGRHAKCVRYWRWFFAVSQWTVASTVSSFHCFQ